MALAVEWLPEEWPDGILSLKQLLVVAPLTTSILLLFRTEITTFAGCGQVAVVRVGFLTLRAALGAGGCWASARRWTWSSRREE